MTLEGARAGAGLAEAREFVQMLNGCSTATLRRPDQVEREEALAPDCEQFNGVTAALQEAAPRRCKLEGWTDDEVKLAVRVYAEAASATARKGMGAEAFASDSMSKFVATVALMLNVTPAMAVRTVDDPGVDLREHVTRRVRSVGTLGITFPLGAWYDPM